MKAFSPTGQTESEKTVTEASRRLERSELYSFLLVASSMALYGAIFVPRFNWLFFGLAILDGYLTYYRADGLISFERVVFGFFAIFLTAYFASFGVLSLMIETVLVIALLDFSLLLRKVRHSDEHVRIVVARLRSYLVSLVPALVFSFTMVYLYSAISSVPKEPILPLALASAGFFVLILVVARLIISTNSKACERRWKPSGKSGQ